MGPEQLPEPLFDLRDNTLHKDRSYRDFSFAHIQMPDRSTVYQELYPPSDHQKEEVSAWQVYPELPEIGIVGRYMYWEEGHEPTQEEWDKYDDSVQKLNQHIEDAISGFPEDAKEEARKRVSFIQKTNRNPHERYEEYLWRINSSVSMHHRTWVETARVCKDPNRPITVSLRHAPPLDYPLYDESSSYDREKLLLLRWETSDISVDYDRKTGILQSLVINPIPELRIPPKPSENPQASIIALVHSLRQIEGSSSRSLRNFRCIGNLKYDEDPRPGMLDQARAFIQEVIADVFRAETKETRQEYIDLLCNVHHMDWNLAKSMQAESDANLLQLFGNIAEINLTRIKRFDEERHTKRAHVDRTDEGFVWKQKGWIDRKEIPNLPSGIVENGADRIPFDEEEKEVSIEETRDAIVVTCYSSVRRDKPVVWQATLPKQIPVKDIEAIMWNTNAYVPGIKSLLKTSMN